MRNRLSFFVCLILLAGGLAVWGLRVFPPARTIPVKPLYMKGLRIFAFRWSLPQSKLWRIPSDDPARPRRSTLALFENGKELGPPHSLHEDVVTKGKGAFSHWNGTLIFSASDNTAPRFNGRKYIVRVRLVPRPWALGAGLAAVVGAAVWLLVLIRRAKAAKAGSGG